MFCSICGREIPDYAAFCPICGSQMIYPPVTCPACGVQIEPGASFCGSCGLNLSASPMNEDPYVYTQDSSGTGYDSYDSSYYAAVPKTKLTWSSFFKQLGSKTSQALLKSLPLTIFFFLISLAVHTYLLVGINQGFSPDTWLGQQLLGTKGQIISATLLWTLFSTLFFSAIFLIKRKGIGELIKGIFITPKDILSYMTKNSTLAPAALLTGAGFALLIAGLMSSTTNLVLAVGVSALFASGAGRLLSMLIRSTWNSIWQVLGIKNKQIKNHARIEAYLNMAGAACGFVLGIFILWDTFLGLVLLGAAAALMFAGRNRGGTPVVPMIILLIALLYFFFDPNNLLDCHLLLADDGGEAEAGGWANWLGSEGSYQAILQGVPPALGMSIGPALGAALNAIDPNMFDFDFDMDDLIGDYDNLDWNTINLDDYVGDDYINRVSHNQVPTDEGLDLQQNQSGAGWGNPIYQSPYKGKNFEQASGSTGINTSAVTDQNKHGLTYNQDGYDQYGYDRNGYNRLGFDKSGYDEYGYDQDNFDKNGYDPSGYSRDGYNAKGYDRDGFDVNGYNHEGYGRDGYNTNGYDPEGYDRDGYNAEGYNRFGYHRDGYGSDGYDVHGYDQNGYGRDGYDRSGFDINGYDRNGFNANDYDQDGYNQEGFNSSGIDREGYDRNGFDADGYNRSGYDQAGFDYNGYDKNGFNQDGYDACGYDREGFNQDGIDFEGYDREGYNVKGIDREGYNRDGFNDSGYDRDGYDQDGYDSSGYDRNGWNKDGFHQNGYDEYGYNREGYNDLGYNREGYDKNGFNMMGYDKDGYDEQGFNREGYNRGGYGRDGYNKDGWDQNGRDRQGYDDKGLDAAGLSHEDNLNKAMDQLIKDKKDEKYFVRNPDLPSKTWNNTFGAIINEGFGDWKGGQCGEFGKWGAQWVEKSVKDIYGEDVSVDTIALQRNHFANHAATLIIKPDGERLVLDFWDGMQKGDGQIMTEKEWLDKWKKKLGAPWYGEYTVAQRSKFQDMLSDDIKASGGDPEKGINRFLSSYKPKNPGQEGYEAYKQSLLTVKSYRRDPW